MIRKGSVAKECTFVFKYDFESSIPANLLYQAIRELDELQNIPFEQFLDNIYPLDCSVVKKIKKIFGVDLVPLKIDIANVVAESINNSGASLAGYWSWWQDEEFMQTELGQFIRFIQDII